MKIVIDIPEEDYRKIKDGIATPNRVDRLLCALLDGTPLPKGHGRLFIFDEEKAKNYFTKFSFSSQDWISEVGISNATWEVIEADEEEK